MQVNFEIETSGYWISKKDISTNKYAKYYEIELCTSICFSPSKIQVIDNVPYQLENMSYIIIKRPGQHRYSIGDYECHFVHFECKNNFFKEHLDALPPLIPTYDTTKFTKIFESIHSNNIKNPQLKSFYTDAKITELLCDLVRMNYSTQETNELHLRYMDRILYTCEYMRNNCHLDLKLENLASFVHLSPTYFHLIFKSIVHKTPYKYLLDIRIDKVKNLLTNTSDSLSNIAEKCGFDSTSYLTYVFKRECNISPIKYRKKIQNKTLK